MSSKKRTENISKSESQKPINLSGKPFSKHKKKSYTPKFKKPQTPHSEIKDIYKDKGQKDSKSPGVYLKVTPKAHAHLISNFLKIAVVGFIILLAINSVNIYKKSLEVKESLTYSAYEGYSQLLEGSRSATKVQFTEARQAFENALKNFEEAETTLWFIAGDDTIYAHESTLASSAKAILNSGKRFAMAGEYFATALEELNKIPLYFVSKNEESALPKTDAEDITDILKKGVDYASLALVETRAARDEIEKINQSLVPQEIRGKLAYTKEKLNQLIQTLESIETHFPSILKLLGDETPHRYLVLFQNNSEVRPSGGFIGSYAIVDINKGVIENLKVEDVYDIDGQYKGTIEPPEEFLPFTSNWRFRDSNYSPDFLYSGKKTAWFLEEEGGPVVDTVIALNQSLLGDFLEITGPIQVGELPNQFSSENYNTILTYIIESKIWGEEDPKHVLKVFVPEFQKAILKKENVSSVMSILYKAVQQKMVMAYSKDSMLQSLFDTLGLSGRFKYLDEKEDFLNVTNISIGGNKTDPFIEEKITHTTFIEDNGTLIDEVTLARTHTFNPDVQRKWNDIWDSFGFDHKHVPGYVVDILGRGQNAVNTRIYVPEGSQLLEVTGVAEEDVQIKYDDELKRAFFLTTLKTHPQNTSTITLRYKLPFKLDFSPVDTYKLTVQKQPGSQGSIFTKIIKNSNDTDADLKPYIFYPQDTYFSEENELTFATNLVYDRYFSAVWGE
jgi:hypothetical protein